MFQLISSKRKFKGILILLLGCLLITTTSAWAEKLTHTVVKGDTLWDICEKYYGDANLWPKLWEMNPFVTNPHFLNPGDTITLFEDMPVRKEATVAKEEIEIPAKAPETIPPPTGIDASKITNLTALGFLSRKNIRGVGKIAYTDSEKLKLSNRDIVYLSLPYLEGVKPGDLFSVVKSSSLQTHPITKKGLGYLITNLGRVSIIEYVGKSLYKAIIVDSFKIISSGDFVVPYEPVSTCVLPQPVPDDMTLNIVAVKDEYILIGQYTVVYLDRGFNHGVQRGNFFDVVKIKKVRVPEVKNPFKIKQTHDFLDKLHQKKPAFQTVLGRILIVESRPDTATGVVLNTTEMFSKGASLVGVSWTTPPDFLSRMSSCLVE